MSTFAEATVTPLPSDGGGMPMEARRDNEESFGGDDVDGKGLSVSTTLTKAEARQAKGMMGWEEDDISFLPVPKRSCLFHLDRLCNRDFFIWKLERILNDVYQVVQFFSDFELQVKERLRSCLFHVDRLFNRDFFIWKLERILTTYTQVVKFLSEGSTSTVICKMSNFVAEAAVTPLPADGE
jgi:hypothetical protein